MMWRQAIDGMKMKAASWMALEKQRIRVCDAAKAWNFLPTDDRIDRLRKEVKRLEAMEQIQ